MVAKSFFQHNNNSGDIQDVLTTYSLWDFQMIPSLKAVTLVTSTIPVCSCSGEAVFSVWPRTTGQNRLMSADKEVSERTEHAKCIDRHIHSPKVEGIHLFLDCLINVANFKTYLLWSQCCNNYPLSLYQYWCFIFRVYTLLSFIFSSWKWWLRCSATKWVVSVV